MRSSIILFLGNRSSHFPGILYEVRVQKVFLIIFTILAKNCPKFVFLAQNGGFFLFFVVFFENHTLYFSIFFSVVEKIAIFDQNRPKFGLNLAYWPDAPVIFLSKSEKMLK